METQYVFDLITQTPKWYAGKFSKAYASKVCRLHREGKFSDKQYLTFFKTFGFTETKQQKIWVEIK